MKDSKRKISIGVKASFVYTLAIIISKGLSFITIPIFTRIMTKRQIGVVDLYNSWFSIIGGVASLSLTGGGFLVALKEYKKTRDEYMSSILSLTYMLSIICVVIYCLFPSYICKFIGLDDELLILMLVGLCVSPATEFWLARQRYEYRYKAAGILTIVLAVLSSLIAVICVLYANKRNITDIAKIRLFSQNIIVYTVALILGISILKRGKKIIDFKYWCFSLSLSLPLVGNTIAGQILGVADRTMISKMVSNEALGVYGTLYTISSLSTIIWGAINSSFVPYLFDNYNKPQKYDDIKRISNSLIYIYAIASLGLTLIAPEIVRIVATREYYSAIYIIPPISAGVFFIAVSSMYSNLLILFKKTSFIMISSISSAILNLVLNYFCIRKWGYIAAAYTTFIAYTYMAILQCIVANKISGRIVNRNVYDDRKVFFTAILTVLGGALSIVLYKFTLIRYMIISTAFIAIIIYRKKIINYVLKQIYTN